MVVVFRTPCPFQISITVQLPTQTVITIPITRGVLQSGMEHYRLTLLTSGQVALKFSKQRVPRDEVTCNEGWSLLHFYSPVVRFAVHFHVHRALPPGKTGKNIAEVKAHHERPVSQKCRFIHMPILGTSEYVLKNFVVCCPYKSRHFLIN